MKSVIFLDFDGVLITLESIQTFGSGSRSKPMPHTVNAMNWLLKESGASIVVSSTWRLDRTCGKLQYLLNEWGIQCNEVDKTPRLIDTESSSGGYEIQVSRPRAEEIQAWRTTNNHKGPYVILDDEKDHLSKDRLVQTDFSIGLTLQDAERALQILK